MCRGVPVTPEWSEQIDERGMPVDPLNANRSRNRVRNLFAHGTITSITLRLRYLSVFCWALDQLPEDTDDRYTQLKNIEKIFCLASRYQQLQANQDQEAIRGMDGNSRFSYDADAFDEITLTDLELLKNDGYAYSQFYENQLQNYLLKRGEFTLTAAGQELAEAVDSQIGSERERILKCARRGHIERRDMDAIADMFANQALYLNDACAEERDILQKVFLGFLEWTGDKQSGTVETDERPTELTLDVLTHLEDTIEEGDIEEVGANRLYQKYHRGYHRYRAAHACFLCRSWHLQSEASSGRIALSDDDKRHFQQYRDLMRLYWLQVYAGYAIEAQLEALCLFLNSRIPPRAEYETLLDRVVDVDTIQTEIVRLTAGLDVTDGTEQASPANITRNLMLYGKSNRMAPAVTVPSVSATTPVTVGQARTDINNELTAWDQSPPVAGDPRINEVLLAKALRNSLTNMREESDAEHRQIEYWTESLARSIALLHTTLTRFRRLEDRCEWLYNYAFNRFESPYTSISELTRLLDRTDDETPLDAFARTLIDEQVVETHLQVFYSRLSPGNLKRALSFDQDERLCLEVDRERGSRPFVARPGFIRFDEMNTLLRDGGLLVEADEGYEPTAAGLDILSRLTEVPEI